MVVDEGMARLDRRAAMTGEWIIYYVHDGLNYYLDVARHEDQKDEMALFTRLQEGCGLEFPFAFM